MIAIDLSKTPGASGEVGLAAAEVEETNGRGLAAGVSRADL